MEISEAVAKIKEKYPKEILEEIKFRDEVTLLVKLDKIKEIARFICEDKDLAFDYLTDQTAVDLFPKKPRFQVVYQTYSMKNNLRLRLKVELREDEKISSVESIWKSANWFEREIFDMFGIKFDEHPDMRRILTWDGFEDFPLRKDYPTKGKDFDKPFKVVL
ncbi:MAG: NADH-quinone oxidoreductase subunit C [Deltaproteobacteria bacterium]|nr:NADH-quinone oxidoreductase subunit C [Deltaproteobacteria bacterium]